jgi:DNA repair photolyase
MKAATLAEIKRALKDLDEADLTSICLRLGRFKKDNKELLTYLLFEQHDEMSYIQSIKDEIEEEFNNINSANLYWAKKSIRKILRNLTKQIRYSGNKQTEVELLMHFCRTMLESGISFKRSPVLNNTFNRQIEKIKKALSGLHEDLQADYEYELEELLS